MLDQKVQTLISVKLWVVLVNKTLKVKEFNLDLKIELFHILVNMTMDLQVKDS